MGQTTWREYRDWLGQHGTRRDLLEFFCWVTGYRPTVEQTAAHIAWEPGGLMIKQGIAGYGSGKTDFGAAEFVMGLVVNPGSKSLIVSPTYSQSREVIWPVVSGFLMKMQNSGFPIMKRFLRSLSQAELHCGGMIYVRTASKIDRVLGFAFSIAWVDESETLAAAETKATTIISRLRERSNMNELILTSTPRGYAGTVRMMEEARNRAETESEKRRLFRWHTTGYRNPYLRKGVLKQQQAISSRRDYDENVLALILRPNETIYDCFDRDRHLIDYEYDPELPYSIGYDPGVTTGAAVFIQYDPDGVCCIFDQIVDDVPVGKFRSMLVDKVASLGAEPEYVQVDRAVKAERYWCQKTFVHSRVSWAISKEDQAVMPGVKLIRGMLDPYDADEPGGKGEPKLYISRRLADETSPRGIVNAIMTQKWHKRPSGEVMWGVPKKDDVTDHVIDAARMLLSKLFRGDTSPFTFAQNVG